MSKKALLNRCIDNFFDFLALLPNICQISLAIFTASYFEVLLKIAIFLISSVLSCSTSSFHCITFWNRFKECRSMVKGLFTHCKNNWDNYQWEVVFNHVQIRLVAWNESLMEYRLLSDWLRKKRSNYAVTPLMITFVADGENQSLLK